MGIKPSNLFAALAESIYMRILFVLLSFFLALSFAHANEAEITVYQDPNCGCCDGWVDHMRESGFTVNSVRTQDMGLVKQKLAVPAKLGSCHTAVIHATGQIVEGHVPASAVRKLLLQPEITGVAAPGMPLNAPGMGELDGNLVTVDFNGREFSRD